MRCLPSMKVNRHSLKKAVLDEQRQLDEIQSGEDKIERFMALVEATATARNIPMKCCVNS